MRYQLISRSKGCAEKSRLLIGDAARNLDTTSMTIFLSTLNLSREVRRLTQKKNIAPTTPQNKREETYFRLFKQLKIMKANISS